MLDFNKDEKICLVELIDKEGALLIRQLSDKKITKKAFNDRKNFLLSIREKLEN